MKILSKGFVFATVFLAFGGFYLFNTFNATTFAKSKAEIEAVRGVVSSKDKNQHSNVATNQKAKTDTEIKAVLIDTNQKASEETTDSSGIQSSVVNKQQQSEKMAASTYRKGDQYLEKYLTDEKVNQLVLVERLSGGLSVASLYLMTKNPEGKWIENFKCDAFLGVNGIGKEREGDGCTPTGDFGFTKAFGIKDNPGSKIEYTKLTETMYLCGDKEYYNQFIDISKVEHKCSGASEHLIRYSPQYNYAIIIDYNKENVFGKGSAIFIHCNGSHGYTMGCISVSEPNMVHLMQAIDKNARICIYSQK